MLGVPGQGLYVGHSRGQRMTVEPSDKEVWNHIVASYPLHLRILARVGAFFGGHPAEKYRLRRRLTMSQYDQHKARESELWTAYCEMAERAGAIVVGEARDFDPETHRETLEILDREGPKAEASDLRARVAKLGVTTGGAVTRVTHFRPPAENPPKK